jgi:hypothetical protein
MRGRLFVREMNAEAVEPRIHIEKDEPPVTFLIGTKLEASGAWSQPSGNHADGICASDMLAVKGLAIQHG